MSFPNAFQGVKKLFNAEILKLIATLCSLIAAIATVITLAAMMEEASGAFVGGGIVTIIFGIGATVLLIIAYIFKLIGLKKAGNDEQRFQQAFILAIFALILSAVAAILSSFNVGNGIVDNIVQIFASVADILITIFVIQGIQNLALKLGKSELAESGRSLMIIILIFYVLGLIATLIPIFFGSNTATAAISGIISIVGLILNLLAYIFFLVYLSRAKKMLAEN